MLVLERKNLQANNQALARTKYAKTKKENNVKTKINEIRGRYNKP